MPYITYQQYTDLYGTPPIPEAEFPVYAQAASDLIDSITQYRIVESGLSALPSLIQNLVEKAAAAQVLYFTQNGIDAVLSGQTGQGFTVAKVHVDGRNQSGQTAAQMMISPMARVYLEQTGLMERGIPCFHQSPSSFYGIL